jgi:hypothetical protein
MAAPYPTKEQALRLTARKLAEEAFAEAEQRFAKGAPFEDAKQAVLEERVPAYIAEHGEAIADLVIHALMGVPEKSTHPAARRAHRNRRWKALVQARMAVGKAPPGVVERWLFEWFRRRPRGMP